MFFQFFWSDGGTSIGIGKTASEACAKLKRQKNTVHLDFCRQVPTPDADTSPYVFEDGFWHKNQQNSPANIF